VDSVFTGRDRGDSGCYWEGIGVHLLSLDETEAQGGHGKRQRYRIVIGRYRVQCCHGKRWGYRVVTGRDIGIKYCYRERRERRVVGRS
jgi:hypothetical protein